MNRPLAVALALVVLLSGATATAAAFTDGDEVAPDSEVYLDAGDSENAERYVEFDGDEIRLQLEPLPPGSQTRIDDLFVLGFAGYEDTDVGTTVRIESTDDRVTLERMDTGDTFESDTVSLAPGESVPFGVTVSTDRSAFSSTIELEVDIPEDEPESSGGGSSDGGSSGSDESNNGGATSEGGAGTGGGEGGGGQDGDGTDPDTGGDGDAGDGDTGPVEEAVGQALEPDGDDQTLEPAGLLLGDMPAEWSLLAGLLAALTNYLVQTRLRDILPVLRTDRSIRRKRLRSVLAREGGLAVITLGLTVLVAGALSSAGVGVTGQVLATLAFSASVGAVTGNRRFPNIQLVDTLGGTEAPPTDGGTE